MRKVGNYTGNASAQILLEAFLKIILSQKYAQSVMTIIVLDPISFATAEYRCSQTGKGRDHLDIVNNCKARHVKNGQKLI